jgi:hypothetical protein
MTAGGAGAANGGSGGSGVAGSSAAGSGSGAAGSAGVSAAGGASVGGSAGSNAAGTAGSGTAGSATSGGAAGSSAGSGGAGGSLAGNGGSAGASGSGGGTSALCTNGGKGAHYVDSSAGNDAADGTTVSTAWKTLAPVNGATFEPGDAICFHAGGSWTGQLEPKGSGSAAAPIVVDQYGTGGKPRINAGAGNLQALLLQNVQYWEVNDLELTNNQAAPGDYRGICVRGQDVGALNHIYIRNCFVHDVTGVVNWIGGDTADNQPPWVTFQAGWDDSKRTGGIVVEVASTSGTKTWFNDVRIENNVVEDTSFAGIVFKQLDGGYGWGVRASRTDSKFTPHTNIAIRDNYISQTNTKYGCNSIYLTGSQHVTIERNVCKDSGTSAIEAYNADDVRIQSNEVFGTVKKAGGADYNGIDTDRATTGAVVQYNYVHNNGDGILLCQFVFGDSIVRYNLLLNNSRYAINLHSDAASTNQTYNNLLFLQGLTTGDLINSSGGATYLASPYTLSNNIFSSSRASVVATGTGVTYTNNLFSGVTATGNATQSGDPMFVDSSARPNGDATGPALAKLAGFQLKTASPARNHGATIANNGGSDFWGNPLYSGAPDIGPFEQP